MKTVFILNPAARNGRAGVHWEKLRSLSQAAGLDARFSYTEYPGHAERLAEEAARGSDVVVAVGGDGTIHQVAEGLVRSGASAALGIIPLGTGNDFVKMLDIPLRLEPAMQILAKGRRKAVDYASVDYEAKSGHGRCIFINTMGIGFDAEVGLRASAYKVLPGPIAYLGALIGTLHRLGEVETQIVLDDDTENPWLSGPILLCSIGNGTTSGGMFRLTPGARIDDQWLDVCTIDYLSVPRVLLAIPRVVRGTHTSMKQYRAARAKKATIEIDGGLPVHVDGENVTTDASRLIVQIVEKGLPVITP